MRVFLRLAHVFLYDSVCACWRVQGRGLKCFLGRETSGTFGIIVSSIWNSQWGKVFPFFGYLRAVHIVSFYQRRVGILHLWGKNLFEMNELFISILLDHITLLHYCVTIEKAVMSEYSLCQVINNHITNRKYLTEL